MRNRILLSIGAAASIGALLLTGCTANGGDGSVDPVATAPTTAAEVQQGFFGNNDSTEEPVSGGTFTFAYTGSILSFDPATQQYAGTSGGNEAAAVYGTLVEFDTVAGEYVPSMAESISANDDFTTWTVGLRDGVTFTDGTAYDADAVKFNMDRLAASGKGYSSLWKQAVSAVTVVDPATLDIDLNFAWADFPYLLSQAAGMIASPTAVQASGEDYLNNPVGAGPFVLSTWTPGQAVELTANENYWDGTPYLDTVIFQTVTGGDQAAADALFAGNAQGSYSGQVGVALEYLDPANELNGYVRTTNTNAVLLMNNGTAGNPDASAKDINVRRAIAQAIDTTVIDERANDGLGLPNSGMIIWDSPSMWQNGDPGLPYDVEAATAALEEAKAAGFDGTVDLLYMQTAEQAALTVAAQLQNVGFEVTTTPLASVSDAVNRVLIASDYDLAMYGWPVPDEPGELFTSYLSRFGSPGNSTGFHSQALEDALKDFAATADPAEKMAALEVVQAEFTEGVPAVPLDGGIGVAAWDGDVHGVGVSSRMTLDFSKAWMQG